MRVEISRINRLALLRGKYAGLNHAKRIEVVAPGARQRSRASHGGDESGEQRLGIVDPLLVGRQGYRGQLGIGVERVVEVAELVVLDDRALLALAAPLKSGLLPVGLPEALIVDLNAISEADQRRNIGVVAIHRPAGIERRAEGRNRLRA